MNLNIREKRNAEQFCNDLRNAKTETEADQILKTVYDGVSTASYREAFSSGVEPDWNAFYAMVETENRFGMDHKQSSYYVMSLIEPKLNKMWSTKSQLPHKKWGSFEDFQSEVWMHILDKMTIKTNKKGKEAGWNPEINDNFLAYISKELMTVLNKVTEPEISRYLSKTYTYAMFSLDELMEDGSNPLQVEDERMNVEAYVERKIEAEENAWLVQKAESVGKKNISRTTTDLLTLKNLFGGVTEDEYLEAACERDDL